MCVCVRVRGGNSIQVRWHQASGYTGEGLSTGTMAAVPLALPWRHSTHSFCVCLWYLLSCSSAIGAEGKFLEWGIICTSLIRGTPGFTAAFCITQTDENPSDFQSQKWGLLFLPLVLWAGTPHFLRETSRTKISLLILDTTYLCDITSFYVSATFTSLMWFLIFLVTELLFS